MAEIRVLGLSLFPVSLLSDYTKLLNGCHWNIELLRMLQKHSISFDFNFNWERFYRRFMYNANN